MTLYFLAGIRRRLGMLRVADGAGIEEDRRACREAGMDDVITKPVSLSTVDRMVDTWVTSRAEVRVF